MNILPTPDGTFTWNSMMIFGFGMPFAYSPGDVEPATRTLPTEYASIARPIRVDPAMATARGL